MKKQIFKNPFTTLVLSVLLLFNLNACTSSERIPDSEFPKAIIGEWLGTVDNLKESIKFKDDGTYIAKVRPTGFLANTLSESRTGTVSGTWLIQGNTITLKITGTKNEQVLNSGTTSTILEFRNNEILLKDEKGASTTFTREVSL